MNTTIFFIRHGEYKNPEKINPGRLPRYKLSKKGIDQINKTALFLKKEKISFIYSSPILRTKQTAKILRQKLGLPKIFYSNLLLEVESGFDGVLRSYLARINFDFYSKSEYGSPIESIKDIENRMINFVKLIYLKHKGQKVIAVSHGDPIMIIRAKSLRLPLNLTSIREPKKEYISFGAVFKIIFEKKQIIKFKKIFKPV